MFGGTKENHGIDGLPTENEAQDLPNRATKQECQPLDRHIHYGPVFIDSVSTAEVIKCRSTNGAFISFSVLNLVSFLGGATFVIVFIFIEVSGSNHETFG